MLVVGGWWLVVDRWLLIVDCSKQQTTN